MFLLSLPGIDVNMTTDYGYTALHWAAANGHVEVVQLVLDAGAELDTPNTYAQVSMVYTEHA